MKQLRITVDGKPFDVTVEVIGETAPTSSVAPIASAPVASAPVTAAPVAAPAPTPAAAPTEGAVASPLSGKVVSLDVPVGTSVKSGDQVMTLEAMKMNTLIFAEADGKVTSFLVNAGDAVQEGQPLYTLG